MVAVAAALVVVLLAVAPGVGGSLAGLLRSAVCNVLGTGCPAPGTATAGRSFEPPPCELSSRTTEDGGSLRVSFVKLGADYTFTRTESANGETKITFVDESTLAAVAGVGGKLEVKAGGRTYGGRVAADGDVGVVAAVGDTWVFTTPEDGDDFEGWIRRETNEDRRGRFFPGYGPLNGLVEWARGEEPLPAPTITFEEAGVAASGSASATVGVASVGVDGSAAVLVGTEVDRDAEESSTYYQVDFGAGAEANALFSGLGGSWEGSGVVKVTRNEADEIVRVSIVDTSTGTLEGLATLGTDQLTLAGLTGKLANDATASLDGSDAAVGTIVSTTDLEVTSDAERAVVRDWVGALDGLAGAAERAVDGGLPDRGSDVASPFGRLLYDRATVSVVEYEGERSGLAFEAEVALGAKLGIDVGATDSSSRAVAAWYLAGPEKGRRLLLPFTTCVDRR